VYTLKYKEIYIYQDCRIILNLVTTCIAVGSHLYSYMYGYSSIPPYMVLYSILAYLCLITLTWLLTVCLERKTFFIGRELNSHHRLSISSEFSRHDPHFILTFTFTYLSSHRHLKLRKSFPLRKSIENYINMKGDFNPALLHHDVDLLLTTVLLK
jgi:hypothetical protein